MIYYTQKKESVNRKNREIKKVREMGLEPTRLYRHKILSLACLPIPALPHNDSNFTTPERNCQYFLKNIYKKIISKIWKNVVDIWGPV